MDSDRIKEEYYLSLYRFSLALSGDESRAATLARRVLADETWRSSAADRLRATEVALFTLAFRLFAGARPIPVPPAHDRIAVMGSLSLQHALKLSTEALLDSFRHLELPQRAALVLFYTTQCSIYDIAAILHQTHEATVAIISRAKAEWLHILQHKAEGQNPPKEQG